MRFAKPAQPARSARIRAVELDRERVLALLRRHGFNTTSFQALEDGLAYWWDSGGACVAYADTPRAWVAAGAPIAEPEALAGVAERFVEAARSRGKRASFFATQDRLARLPGMRSVPVGLQPVWDPRTWAERARSSRSFRGQLARARNKGVVVRRARADELRDPTSSTRRAAEALVERWLGARRMAPMGFLVSVQPFSFAEERRVYLAERDGCVVGCLSAVPVYARNGWFLEDLLRDRDAPNGTMELLVDAAMHGAAQEGCPWATLGLAPLSGPVPPWMRGVGALARPLYDFAGVRAFKAKFAPAGWEPVYVTHPRDVRTPVAVLDALRAFAGENLLGFALRTMTETYASV